MTGTPVDLTTAHLLDLRRGDTNEPLTDLPAAVVPNVHETSPTGWGLDLAMNTDTEVLLTIITAPDGQRVVFADQVRWSWSASSLANVHHLGGIIRDRDGDFVVPVRPGWLAQEAWTRAERLHAIARALPRLKATGPSSRPSVLRRHAIDTLAWCLLSADEAVAWQAAGVTDPTMARRYAWHGHTPAWSRGWIDLDCEQKWAVQASTIGWIPPQIAALDGLVLARDPRASVFPPRRQWVATGLPPRTALLACAAGLSPDEARAQADTLDGATLTTLAALQGLPSEVLAAATATD